MIYSIDSDASQAAVALAGRRIAATCDKHGITLDQALCEELAELVLLDYRAFYAGVRFAQAHKPAAGTPDRPTRSASTLPEELHGLTYEQATPEQIARTREHVRTQLATSSGEPDGGTVLPDQATADGRSSTEPGQ